jgi:hypothetical protein
MAEKNVFQVGGGEALAYGALILGEKDEVSHSGEMSDLPVAAEAKCDVKISAEGKPDVRVSAETKLDLDLKHDLHFKASFADQLHHYFTECIRVADQKAAFLFIVSSSILAFLFEHRLDGLLKDADDLRVPEIAIIGICAVTLLAAVGFAAWVVRPRFRKSHGRHIFWKDAIENFPSPQDYSHSVLSIKTSEFIEEKLQNCHDLALLCQEKYHWLNRAIYVVAAGCISALAALPLPNLASGNRILAEWGVLGIEVPLIGLVLWPILGKRSKSHKKHRNRKERSPSVGISLLQIPRAPRTRRRNR